MRKPFVPPDLPIPDKVDFDGYYAIPIKTTNAVEDWQVLTHNAEMIAKLRGEGSRTEWPFVCTLEDNYKDLAWLELCHTYRQLFCYIFRSSSDDRYIGCVYIYPIELFFADKVEQYDVDYSCWVTKETFDKGMYDKIFNSTLQWLVKGWHFDRKRIFLRNKLLPENIII